MTPCLRPAIRKSMLPSQLSVAIADCMSLTIRASNPIDLPDISLVKD